MKPDFSPIETLICILGTVSFVSIAGMVIMCFTYPGMFSIDKNNKQIKPSYSDNLVVEASNPPNTNNMNYLFLKRKESEPGRGSYERTWVFIIKENILSFKRFGIGVRTDEDTTKRITLTETEVQEVNALIADGAYQRSQKEFKEESVGNIQLRYLLNLHIDNQKHEQHYFAPDNYISRQHMHMDTLWRLLAKFVRNERPSIKATYTNIPEIKMNLRIAKKYKSKDTETKVRSYQLNGKKLTIEHNEKGVHRSHEKTETLLSDKQYAQIFQLLESEKESMTGIYDAGTARLSQFYLPEIEGHLEVSYDQNKSSLNVQGGQLQILDLLPYILLESLEQILVPVE